MYYTGRQCAGRKLESSKSQRLNFGTLRTADQSTIANFVATSPHCAGMDAASAVPAGEIDVDALEDVSTGDWGLEMLVRVGEGWASALLTMTQCAPADLSVGFSLCVFRLVCCAALCSTV